MARLTLVALLSLCSLALAGCAYVEREWREVDLGAVHFEDAWNAMVEIAEIDGFPLDPGGSDRGKRILETRWRTRAMPFRGSVRRRLHAEFEREEGATAWMVRFYVERQNVPDVSKGFDPEEEDWESDGQDSDIEDRFIAKMNLRFHGLQPTERPGPDASELRAPDGRFRQ